MELKIHKYEITLVNMRTKFLFFSFDFARISMLEHFCEDWAYAEPVFVESYLKKEREGGKEWIRGREVGTLGLKFYPFWNFKMIQTEIYSYWQNNKFLLFAKCLKMHSFFNICSQCLQKVLIWCKNVFFIKISMGYQKTHNFMLITSSS